MNVNSPGTVFSILETAMSWQTKTLIPCMSRDSSTDFTLELSGGIPPGIEDLWITCGSRKTCQYTWDMVRNTNKEIGTRFKPRCRFDRLYLRHSHPQRVRPAHFGLVGIEKVSGTQSFPSDHWGLQVFFEIKQDSKTISSVGKANLLCAVGWCAAGVGCGRFWVLIAGHCGILACQAWPVAAVAAIGIGRSRASQAAHCCHHCCCSCSRADIANLATAGSDLGMHAASVGGGILAAGQLVVASPSDTGSTTIVFVASSDGVVPRSTGASGQMPVLAGTMLGDVGPSTPAGGSPGEVLTHLPSLHLLEDVRPRRGSSGVQVTLSGGGGVRGCCWCQGGDTCWCRVVPDTLTNFATTPGGHLHAWRR
ncbi:hypothetical protein PR048_024947 [Dryococelus australis]|uniref:Uncharacterized protein n=1 Tax=Dryococelus australis TaxID=614101 RepID=A0ABQ9GQ11_9NEOP|nr:hypothetical protein PR048_024947 [Dryococelus australis]